MQYRNFGKTGVRISALGFGTMRFPLLPGGAVDEGRAIDMLHHAIDQGVNYIDTAYPYHDGMSEGIVGRVLLDGWRDRTYLATKSPVWQFEKPEDFDAVLEEQLRRLKTDHIDFYLLHALSRERMEQKVMPFDLVRRMEKARDAGKIRYLGFSFHDSPDVFPDIIDYYDGWDFCQIQYNYVDIEHQAGKRGLLYAASKGLGVVVMEPLLGGRLADPAPHIKKALGEEKTPVEYALDFLWDQPQVSLLLSGMSDERQVEDNLSYASKGYVGMVSPAEREAYREAGRIFREMALVGCTGCRYCMPCPFGLDIPGIFSLYNRTASHEKEEAQKEYAALEKKAGECRACGRCEKECPQGLPVSGLMIKAGQALA